ncbi:MAG TPA: glycosyltransferase family 39 protein [Gemmataceae bacterium]|nr:glycosyltransferase family 39 protein [Gemmataceae bacterium]
MSTTPPAGLVHLPVWACRLLAALLILAAVGLRIAYLTHDCPLDLSPDEAHYWDWSRHLDWSYYSKGPLVAYLIRGGCEAFGAWSEQHAAGLTFAVRMPAVVCGALLLLSLYVLTAQVYRRERLALGVVALALTLPALAAGATLMTIDAPYACCWGWALVLGHQAVFRGSRWAWPATGAVVGLGILAKYTMVLWLPSAGLFLLLDPQRRRLLARPGFWIMSAIAGLFCLPILIWNMRNGWVTFRHVDHLAGDGFHWSGPLDYVGGQAALLMGYWFLVWLAAMTAHRLTRQSDAGADYLWWMSAPMFLLFFALSFKTGGGEPNWPATAYVSGVVLATAWLARQLASPSVWYRRSVLASAAVACGLGLAVIVVMHHTDWVQPLLAQLSGPATADRPMPLRRFDPTCRLRGWRALGEAVDRERNLLWNTERREPVLAGVSWSLPGELGVYCAGHPQAYSIGLALGDRHSQYDLWPNPLSNVDSFRGRTFIVIGGLSAEARKAFEVVEKPYDFVYSEAGQPIALWTITVCHGYQGFPPSPNPPF